MKMNKNEIANMIAGNEINELVAVEIFGYIRLPFPAVPHLQRPTRDGVEAVYNLDDYSGDWRAAGKIIDFFRTKKHITCSIDNCGKGDSLWETHFNILTTDGLIAIWANAPTAPLSISRAALLIIEEKRQR
jgi:hypothetical protein